MRRIQYRGALSRAAIALACVLVSGMTSAVDTGLYLVTEESPPSNMRSSNGQIIGSGTDKVLAIMQRTSTPYTLAIFPWARAYNIALHQANACVFSASRTPEREAHFKWVGPLHISEWILFQRADHPITLNTLEDARPYTIGTYNGDVEDEYLRRHGFRVNTAFDPKDNLRELIAGKVDLWASDRDTARTLVHKLSTHPKVVPALVFNRVGLYLACNRGVSDSLIEQLKAANEAMKKDGTARAIEQKYQAWPSP